MVDEIKQSDEGQVDLKDFEQTPAPEQEIEGVSVDPVAQEVVEQVKEEPVAEDRSAFNCTDCKGLGLQDNQTLCTTCGGTGKV